MSSVIRKVSATDLHEFLCATGICIMSKHENVAKDMVRPDESLNVKESAILVSKT